jgi:hypothetical protein
MRRSLCTNQDKKHEEGPQLLLAFWEGVSDVEGKIQDSCFASSRTHAANAHSLPAERRACRVADCAGGQQYCYKNLPFEVPLSHLILSPVPIFRLQLLQSSSNDAMPMISAVILAILVTVVYAYFFWPVDRMKAPDAAGMLISREAFETIPKLYFYLLRNFGGGVAASVFSGFPGSLICVVSFLWRFVVTGFMYGGILRGFLFPVVCSLFSFGCAIASFLYGGLLRGIVIPVACSLLSISGGAAAFLYGSLFRGFLIPLVCSLLNFGGDVACIMYSGLVRGFLMPVVSSLLRFGVDVASFLYDLLSRDFFIPFVLGLLAARVMGFLFG